MRITIMGQCIELKLPEELDKLIVDGRLADLRTGAPSEKNGYSAYLGLKAIEMKTGHSLRKEKSCLLDAVIRRLDETNPPFSHGHFTGSPREMHMRFTAAAVRLLGEALRDDLLNNSDTLVRAVRYHFPFSERLSFGTWFLHDSLEVAATGIAYPGLRTKNRAWGSSLENNLVLNTHLDTLSTAIHILPLLPEQDAIWMKGQIQAGIAALRQVLSTPAHIWNVLSAFDNMTRNVLFATYRFDFFGPPRDDPWYLARAKRRVARKLGGVIKRAYFPIRAQLRARWPNYVMSDGYLERDISLGGTAFDYHFMNCWDLARCAHQLRTSEFSSHTDIIQKLDILVDRGIDYAINSTYRDYLTWLFLRYDNEPIILCEAILARIQHLTVAEIPEKWIEAYCDVRRRVAPSLAMLGYDPLIGTRVIQGTPVSQDEDQITLHDGRRLKIAIPTARCEWL